MRRPPRRLAQNALRLAALAASLALCLRLGAVADGRDRVPVRAGTEGRDLLAPPARDGFRFVIFGDRTGGTREGLAVLAEGVRMANRLDPDFVMTVGDLVQGYGRPEAWLAEMREYRDHMAGLAMPWFPVAGNHDVYSGDGWKGGHVELYSEHFGPLWYSFDHRWAHFVVLFSDEELSYSNPPVDQNVSPEQLAWLEADLAATEAEQVFVFLHHPRWLYPGTNWDEVHELFRRDGRVAAVFAGHLHKLRDDGVRDGVHYYVIGRTGASAGTLLETSSRDHLTQIQVRRDGYAAAVLPVGGVWGGDAVLGTEVDAMLALRTAPWLEVEGRVAVSTEGERASRPRLVLANATDRELAFAVEPGSPAGFAIAAEPRAGALAPGERRAVELAVAATAPAGALEPPEVVVRLDFPLASGLVQPFERSVALPLELPEATAIARRAPEANGVLALDGASAVRVDLDAAFDAFTLETWARGAATGARSALVAKTENSAFGIFWGGETRGYVHGASLPETGRPGYAVLAPEIDRERGRWTHLALVWDGERARLFVDGALAAEAEASGPLTPNALPLWIGADPNGAGAPTSFFRGALDELRLSSTARYATAFEPPERFEPDADTRLLLHFDRKFAGLFPDASDSGHHGWPHGAPRIEREER